MARAFADEVRVIAEQYPESRSAVMPALRIAQERHGGWLPPEALEEVAEALDLTPAYCKGVATFYDMFHLEPVGRHMVEVCTNICCGLRGAQQVLEAFEAELGVRPGETTEDGDLTRISEYRSVGGYEALAKARAMTADAVIEDLNASNLRGRGGAFFATGR